MKLELNPTQQKRLAMRAHRRLVAVGNQLWWVITDSTGIQFQEYRHKGSLKITWQRLLEFTERQPEDTR